MKKTFSLRRKKKQIAKIDEELANEIIEIIEEKLDVILLKSNNYVLENKKKDVYKKIKSELFYEITDLISINRKLFMYNKA